VVHKTGASHPGGDFILEAQYRRLGPDFFLSGEDHSFFVKGYFTHEQAPDLYTTDGSAVVGGLVATRLYIANLGAKNWRQLLCKWLLQVKSTETKTFRF